MMALSDLLKGIEVIERSGESGRYVGNLHYDSRQVSPGDAFVAIRGFQTDGHSYVEQAREKGAGVIFAEDDLKLGGDVSVVRVKNTRKAMPRLAANFFNHPERRLKIIGITGTNGKTTTAYLLYSILKQAQLRPGLITTIEYDDGERRQSAERTTPEALDLWRLFYKMNKNRLKSCVMEVSSHALSLHRVEGIRFQAAVFTNLGRDHLDFHGSPRNYFLAKRSLFEGMTEFQKVILNADDPFSENIARHTEGEVFTYSMEKDATVRYLNHQPETEGMAVRLETPAGELMLESGLLGKHNIYNLMAAATTAVALGLRNEMILEGIKTAPGIAGRCQIFSLPKGGAVYVDYAHTPDALRQILQAALETRPAQLLLVFGAGGNRDRGKRPEMGKAAEDYADRIFLTNDNPRGEDPQKIMEDIISGIYDREKVSIMPDRAQAIRSALSAAGKNDVVVIAGKGHEKYQEIGSEKLPFDDVELVQTFIEENE
ncbi:MAG: UDP-N-acetylmuramoyl-L-alanyl-D-glutamate--2,6-diaminopimelate ligase [Calditrichia bacterium]